MQKIRKLFDTYRKHFEKGGKFEKLYPLFDATETFFFIPDHVTKIGPHVRDSLDVKRFMGMVLAALIPPFLFSIYNTGYQSNLASGLPLDVVSAVIRGAQIVLPLVILSYAVGMFWEFLFASVRKHQISEGFFVTALLYPMTLPPTIPLWQAAMGISFGVVIGKEIFGGTGRNFLNPALTGRAFIYFAYPGKMSGDAVWTVVTQKTVDAASGATPLAAVAVAEIHTAPEALLEKAGYTFWKLFLGLHPGSIGETSALLCLIGAVFLTITGIASYRIIIGGIAGALVTGFLINISASELSAPFLSLNPFYHLVMGGFAFGITYMATEPVTAPDTETARWIYGAAIGALTIIIRVFNPAYPEGIMLAILFMNVFAPLMDHIVIKIRLKKRVPNV